MPSTIDISALINWAALTSEAAFNVSIVRNATQSETISSGNDESGATFASCRSYLASCDEIEQCVYKKETLIDSRLFFVSKLLKHSFKA